VGTVALILVLGMTLYYFIPVKTYLPLMAGSTRVVFDSCFKLPPNIPRTGIGWGDISMGNERYAGFGGVVGRMVHGVKYPGDINLELHSQFDDSRSTELDTDPLVWKYRR